MQKAAAFRRDNVIVAAPRARFTEIELVLNGRSRTLSSLHHFQVRVQALLIEANLQFCQVQTMINCLFVIMAKVPPHLSPQHLQMFQASALISFFSPPRARCGVLTGRPDGFASVIGPLFAGLCPVGRL